MFNNIDIMLSDTVGRLKCSATGDPAPTLFWIQPNGRTTKYAPSQLHHQQPSAAMLVASSSTAASGGTVPDNSDGSRRTDGVLLLKPDGRQQASSMVATPPDVVSAATGGGASGTVVAGTSGMYICIANNEAGNVTLAVNVSWPQFNRTPSPQQPGFDETLDQPATTRPTSEFGRRHPADVADTETSLAANRTHGDIDVDLYDEQTEGFIDIEATSSGVGGRLFSVSEMICAVVVTHVITLVISLVIVAIFVRRRVGKLRRQQQLLPPPMHVATGPPLLGGSSAGGGGGMCLGGAGAGGYRLPPNATGSLCRPIPSYATDYAVYDNAQSRTTMGGGGAGIIPFSYHLRPAMT